MPPRLAFYMLDTTSVAPNISRTPWDEMCSIFLCFIHTVLDEHPSPYMLPLEQLASRMTLLLQRSENYCSRRLRPQYKENPVIVSRIQQALTILFPKNSWIIPSDDHARSMEWWNKMRNILDLLASES